MGDHGMTVTVKGKTAYFSYEQLQLLNFAQLDYHLPNPFSAGTVFIRQNLTSTQVRF